MKGSQLVIDRLNVILKGELTAINQYFLHARMQKDWGYVSIAEKTYKESIEEMRHAEKLVDRILFLDGVPNLQDLGKLNIGESVVEQFQSDLALEMQALQELRASIKVCFDEVDHVTRELFEDILTDEEEHIDWIESQLSVIKDVGVENYLSEMIKS